MHTFLLLMISLTTFEHGFQNTKALEWLPKKLRRCLSCWTFWVSLFLNVPFVMYLESSIFAPFAAWFAAKIYESLKYEI